MALGWMRPRKRRMFYSGSQHNAYHASGTSEFGIQNPTGLGTLLFNNPVAVRTSAGETNRLFVVEQGGRIWVITNLTAPTKKFLDFSGQVLVGQVAGLFALAFHPGYKTNGLFFVGYNLNTQTAAGTGSHYRV